MEEEWFFRLLTFNLQLMFRPDEAPLDWNEGEEVIRRATNFADALLKLDEAERPHVICLQEVFYVGAFDLLKEKLCGEDDWKHCVWLTEIDGKRMIAGSAIGFGIAAIFAGGDPLLLTAGASLGAYMGGPFYANHGGNSGLMILSRKDHPFQKIDKAYSGNRPGDVSLDDVDDYTALTARYDATAGADALSSKGFLMVRVQNPRYGNLNILTTHTQASYEDECLDDVHYGDTDCKLYADVRRLQFDQIMRSLEYALPWDEVGRTIITGDMNIRGEQDVRTFVKEDGATVSEWSSLFEAVVNDPFQPKNFAIDFREGWHTHTRLPAGVVAGAGMIDDGLTNVNYETERGQRLDYILYPRTQSFRLEPHLMKVRWGNLSDHRSLEATFAPSTPFDSPARADVLANQPVRLRDGIKTAEMSRLPARVPTFAQHGRGRPEMAPRYDWTLADFRDVETCIAEAERHPEPLDPKAYCMRSGRIPGTYAVAAFVGSDSPTEMSPVALDVLYCDDLSTPAVAARIQDFPAEIAGYGPPAIAARERTVELPATTNAVHALTRPVYLRAVVGSGQSYLLRVKHFSGNTCETALVALPWRTEETEWPAPVEPGGVPNDVHERWYQLAMRRHSADLPYGCRVVVRNPDRHSLDLTLFDGVCGSLQPRLEGDKEVHAGSNDQEIGLDWTATGVGETCCLCLKWSDPGQDMSRVRLIYQPRLSVFADKPAIKSLLCKCRDETGWDAAGSDEILIRVYVDDHPERVYEFQWNDVDTGKYLPGPACPAFNDMIEAPVVFTKNLMFTVTETGDVDGRDRGAVTISALAEGDDNVAYGRDFDVGSGKYRVTGTVCRDEFSAKSA